MALNVGLLVAITVPSIWLLLVLIPIIARLVKGKKSYKGKHVLITGGSSGYDRERTPSMKDPLLSDHFQLSTLGRRPINSCQAFLG
ncbi:hypothetical protein T484DRAFT_1858610 [Baffinella frigidus]|nr:hypothetical protein T484DRAFT_1858610 [Cryptophyta sp. CCMP2293]